MLCLLFLFSVSPWMQRFDERGESFTRKEQDVLSKSERVELNLGLIVGVHRDSSVLSISVSQVAVVSHC